VEKNRRPPDCPLGSDECSLDCLAHGQKGKVAHVSGPNRCRLLEMGFTAGTEVEVARRAAFGGPLEIRVRSYRLSLRMEEAQAIQVQTQSDETE
jgi:ferrous iron transport protein A